MAPPLRPLRQRLTMAWVATLAALAAWACAPAQAASLAACSPTAEHTAAVQDRLLQVASVLRTELEAAHRTSGQRVALVARSGQALQRLGHRYSHAGLSLKASPQTPWSVRQLYFACDEQRPRVFDEGLARFVMGTHDPALGHLLVLMPPPEAAAPLEPAALDDTLALQLLGHSYSANAHAWGLQHQNCNQWVAELLATAWAPSPDTEANTTGPGTARPHAQQALRHLGYQPSVVQAHWPPIALGAALLPWFHTADHPADDVAAGRFVVSMPAALHTWVQQRWPASQTLELCHTERHVLLRRDGPPLDTMCHPQPGDEVTLLN